MDAKDQFLDELGLVDCKGHTNMVKLTEAEYRLAKYVINCFLDDKNCNLEYLTIDERLLLETWFDRGYVISPITNLKVSMKFINLVAKQNCDRLFGA